MSDLTVQVQNGVCHIAITRPAKRNTLNAATCLTCVEVLAQAQKDEDVRCVVISGEGGVFCAGADLEETLHRTADTQKAYDALIESLIAFDKPTREIPICAAKSVCVMPRSLRISAILNSLSIM